MKIHKKSAPKEEAEGEDENLECRDCGAEFVFSAGEQAFYKEKGFDNKPTRCAECKAAKKARFDDGGGGGGGRGGGRGGRGGFGGPVKFYSLLAHSTSIFSLVFEFVSLILLPFSDSVPPFFPLLSKKAAGDVAAAIAAVEEVSPSPFRFRDAPSPQLTVVPLSSDRPRRRWWWWRRRRVLRLPEGRVHPRRLVPLLPLVNGRTEELGTPS
jgi:hypothetical protein